MKTILDQLGVQVFPLVLTAVGTLLCAVLGLLTSYIKSKTKNSKVQGVLERLDQAMEDAVKDTQQRIVSNVTPGEDLATILANAKTEAIASAKSHYGEKGLEELKTILGWDNALLDKNLSVKLEAKVHDMKQANGVTK